jgi:malate synthase
MSLHIAESNLSPSLIGQVLTPAAIDLCTQLHRTFDGRRQELLARRAARQASFDRGELPRFLAETDPVRTADWQVAATPPDLQKRRVEITGPVERKMMINALNSGASVFMADFEDSLSPTWANVIGGQVNLMEAVRRTLSLSTPEGKTYKLADQLATLLVRPRGWHLPERHVTIDGQPISASLFDAALYLFHNGKELVARGTGPYFYLPKMESHLEARLWNDVFNVVQDAVGLPRGTVRATVLIETLPAAFEMDEILFELRQHSAGLNAGRWDYIFSTIKKLRNHKELLLPDRAQVTMTVPHMRSYTELLVRTCHRRGAHAMGGMSAYIPSRKDAAVNEAALTKVRDDKEREAGDGFDGTWVAHPDLVPVAMEVFDRVVGDRPHQKHRLREEVRITAQELVNVKVPGGKITEAGVCMNINVALQYVSAWLNGNGAVAIHNLMEDAATAEISRAQLWQWLKNAATLDDGRTFDRALYQGIREAELAQLGGPGAAGGKMGEAAQLLDQLVLTENFIEFLTLPAYARLD